ncbi:uncharacterized protein MELLADRAFT_67781 [Melampsora larici-populina 98AG31]|uniref:Uncharacterized protein n=1 Tax=Melampsora larici-populina (strain 98AG31 / pathotype 3-4-7) TaxID=747676 RepID=F4S495_MELLP|nr:uncharacterized protein MELLADRAFT_67781 [Melampsora larici-populina 98AG31]EGG00541.1 hypothetical protein MELLADRAFT_67781 [Melampsora larici-populina 98AG31]
MGNIEKKEAHYDDLDAKIASLAEDNKKFYEQAVHYKEILNEYETLSRQKENREEMVDDLLEGMEEMIVGGSFYVKFALLQKISVNFWVDSLIIQSRMKTRGNIETNLGLSWTNAERPQGTKEHLANLELKIAKLRQKHQNKFTEFGQLKAQTQRHVSALEERQDLVRRLSGRHQIQGFEGLIDDRQVEEFLNTLTESQSE